MNNKKTVAEIGEFGLIDRIQKILPQIDQDKIQLGIGDDTAVIKIDASRSLLITCDIQVENQHFRLKHISPYQLGRRAMAINLSDIAAMGGNPTFALISLGFPKSFLLSDFEQLFHGMQDQLAAFSGMIIGGNLTNTNEKLIIDITMLGEVNSSQYVTRHGAQPGNYIFVTGRLGKSGAGFHLLEKFGNQFPDKFSNLVQAHLQPIPRIEIGQKIAQSNIATAMIDISDGIASDLYHICTMSHIGAEIYQNEIPIPDNIKEIESITNKSYIDLALHSGEDYELLFTVKSDISFSLINSISNEFHIPITKIGRILPNRSDYYLIDPDGEHIPIIPQGWDHFRKNSCI